VSLFSKEHLQQGAHGVVFLDYQDVEWAAGRGGLGGAGVLHKHATEYLYRAEMGKFGNIVGRTAQLGFRASCLHERNILVA
jgi:hypothetical protein